MQLAGIDSGTSTAAAQGTPSPRLVSAAHEFEGQMMNELLKPMTNGDPLTGSDDGDAGGAGGAGEGSGGALGEFASEALGRALSDRGGFGIADSIIRQLSHTGNHPENGKVTKNVNQKHELRASQ